MKRKVVTPRASRARAYDVRKDLSKESLAGIGAVALVWNDLQAMLEIMVCVCLDIFTNAWRELATRLGGIEDKIELSRVAFKSMFRWTPELLVATDDTLAAIAQYKGYRDTIIHSRVIDVEQGIAEMTFRRNRVEEVLITEKALNSLYDHIFVTIQEVRELISVGEAMHTFVALEGKDASPIRMHKRYASRLAATREGKPGILWATAEGFISAQDAKATARELQDAISKYQHYQRQRKDLQPLPSFPRSPPTPQQMGERRANRGRRRKEAGKQEPS
jgi:hypothetical protein